MAPKSAPHGTERRMEHFILRCIFFSLLFIYFYAFQTPLLILGQHRLSHGVTEYNPFVGALILSALLSLLQGIVAKLIRFDKGCYLLSGIPSVIAAILVTAFTPTPSIPVIVTLILILVGYVPLSVYVFRQSRCWAYNSANHPQKHTVRLHLLTLLMLTILLGLCSHSNDVVTYEVMTAEHLRRYQYEKALEVGKSSLATSPRLTALRAFALSQYGDSTYTELPERLFTLPLPSLSAEMLVLHPEDDTHTRFPSATFCRRLGGQIRKGESATDYFERMYRKAELDRKTDIPAAVKDYWLCALLMEKNLNAFVKAFTETYPEADSLAGLPRAYREAICLYNRKHADSLQIATDPNTLANYKDFLKESQRMREKSPHATSTDSQRELLVLKRKNHLRQWYGGTYWWWYFYN